ncbi:SapB/AmfS family lantipeptide [Nocardiopsis ganjiahuensis]|nr:SapB/AmfS family lantipeptide [Nocardiopsis ganjiahuensis]
MVLSDVLALQELDTAVDETVLLNSGVSYVGCS